MLFFVPSGTVTMLATFLRPNKPCVLALVWLCHLIDPVRMNLGDVETEVYKIGGGRLPPHLKKNHRHKIRHVKVRVLVAQSCLTLLQHHGLLPARLLCPWDSPGKNTGVGCHFLLQGNFSTQGWNPALLHYRQILYLLSH